MPYIRLKEGENYYGQTLEKDLRDLWERLRGLRIFVCSKILQYVPGQVFQILRRVGKSRILDSNFCGIYLATYYSTQIWATETTEFPTKDVVAWMDLPEVPWYIEEMLNNYGMSLKEEDETNETD